MKINATAECLALISEALKTSIEPEITLKNGKIMLDIIQATLSDLLKRQKPSISLLRRIIQDGEKLEQEMLRLLGSPIGEECRLI